MSHPVVVVGAGLSGLCASHLLAQAGRKVLLIEARDRVGGRILSDGVAGQTHRVDLGPSWFWPGMNSRMERLISELGLGVFPQHTQGAYAIEAPDGAVHHRSVAWTQSPASWRVEGGMQSLVAALHARIADQVHITTGTRLWGMTLRANGVELTLEDANGRWTQMAEQLVLTIPPRLTAQDLHMEPAWPHALLADMQHTPTWMAGQAKFAAVYPHAFWREAGLSGDAMSNRGPMVEIHDASDASGEHAALFGFVGASPSYRAGIGRDELVRQSLAQLVRIFGERAGQPLWCGVQDWAQEPLTAASADQRPLAHHPMYQDVVLPSEWKGRLWLAGTERSADHGGYLEGALESAERAVQDLLAHGRAPRQSSAAH